MGQQSHGLQGVSFAIDGHMVTWQQWRFRVSFNYREGLVLHDVHFQGRSVLARAALVEMTVPYGEPRHPYESKNAGDVSDYGLGFCAQSLQLCADCAGAHCLVFSFALLCFGLCAALYAIVWCRLTCAT